MFGSWLPRIADVKQNLGLSDGVLGLVLLALPAGTFIALTFASPLIKKSSPARALLVSLIVWSFIFLTVAVATSALWLAAALVLCGVVMGILEIACNLEADTIETQIGKRIMSRCHGFWSLGAMTGALLGGPVFAHNGFSILQQFLILSPVFLLASWITCRTLLKHGVGRRAPVDKLKPAKSTKRAPLNTVLVLLCIVPLGVMAIEGAVMDWSAVFMRETLKTDAATAGYTFALFAGVMAIVRLAGDSIAVRFGDVQVVRFSGLSAATGMALLATATSVPVALIGAVLTGVGVAIVYPLTMSAVARLDQEHREDNVAYLSIAAFSVMLLTPPVIGGIAEIATLRIGLLCLVPGAVLTLLLASRLRKTSTTHSSPNERV